MKTKWLIGKMWGERPRGQVIVLLCLSILVVMAFAAMGIDFGMMYLSKAKLSRAVDSLGLRLAGNISLDSTSNARVAFETIKANYTGFLGNVSWDPTNNTTIPASAMTITPYGSGSIIAITNETDSIYVTNLATFFPANNPICKVVSVSAGARTKHNNFFLPVLGSNFNYINLSENATARRVPTIVCLILDTSGSMRDNSGYSYLPQAVNNFIANFKNTQDQDFMSVVTFSTYASLRWPTNYLTNPSGYPANMIPSTNFVNDINGFMTNDPTSGGIMFASGTCGQEGIRLGYKVVNNLLGTVPDDQRKLIRVFYIIFTDGDFNTVRGYFTGNGYNTIHDSNSVPWFHKQLPLTCNNDNFSSYTSVPVVTNISGGYGTFTSAGKCTNFNLNSSSRFGNYDGSGSNNSWTLRAGVSGTVYDPANQKSTPASMNVSSSIGNSWKTNTNSSGYRYWSNYFVYRAVNASGVTNVVTAWNPNATRGYTDTNVTNSSSFTNVYTDVWRVAYFNSCQQNAPNYTGLWIPDMPVFDVSGDVKDGPYNPVYRTNYPSLDGVHFTNTYPAESAFSTNFLGKTGLTSRLIANYPGGGYYANTYNTYYQQNTTDPNSHRPPINPLDNNVNWDNNTVRLSDFYPNFTYGDNPLVAVTNSTFVANYTTASQISNYAKMNGYPTTFYSYSNGASTTINASSYNTAVGNEGYWLSIMQAWIMRKEQNAKIYFVNFSTASSANELFKRQIANDWKGVNGSGVQAFFSDQPTGAYYYTTDQGALNNAFKDIAQKINTQLTK